MFTHTIADMLTRIRNGYMAKKATVEVPYSKMKTEIANLLVKEGYVQAVEVKEAGVKKSLLINLKYHQGQAAINKITRISKSGRRIYKASDKLPYVLSGLGEAIISTSKGIMTAKAARKNKIGGEIICYVY
ncbi:30S ribosomal protein S8 [Candidatus Beckwithbacteria bacterium]|nr:30S ribosomal protein S8 [Candidatus Beckwithbacteria bacterium]